MDLKMWSFASRRIFWSRIIVILVAGYILWLPAPRYFGPTLLDLGEMLGFFLLVVAALGRVWCLSFIAGVKNEILVTEGPYSAVRNPLYGFNFLGMMGLGLAVENPPLALLLAIGFAVFYPSVVRREEAQLARRFGDVYIAYRAATPRWIPDWSAYREPESWVISPRRFRKGLLDAMWFLWAFMLWEIIEEFPIVALLRSFFY